MYSLYQIFIYISAATIFCLTGFVFYKNKFDSLSKSFGLLNLAFFIWLISYSHIYSTQDVFSAYWSARIGFTAITLVPIFLSIFMFNFLEMKLNKKTKWLYIISAFILIILNFFSNLIISNIETAYWGKFPSAGKLFFLIFIYAFLILVYTIYTAYKYVQQPKTTSIKKQKTIYLILVNIAYLIFFIFDNLFSYNLFNFEPTFYLSILFCSVLITIILSSYNLSNIKVTLIKFFIFIFMMLLVFVLSNYILISSTNIYVSSFIILAITLIFFTFYKKIISIAENILLSRNKHYQNLLIHAASGMAREHNIDRLLKLISIIVLKTVKVSFVAIFLENKEQKNYEIKIFRAFSNLNNELLFSYDYDHPFVNFIKHKENPFLYDEIPQYITRSIVLPLRAGMIIPSFFEDIKGFMIIGEKNNKDVFTKEDAIVFKMLARQTSLAIGNCLFFEEYKQAQEKISAAEKLASIGGLAEGVAHQIRNRLHQFSIISGELKYEIKDFEEKNKNLINDNKKLNETFDYIKELSLSLKSNVERINEIIRGILDFAKMEAKHTMFEKFLFKEVVDLAYDMLKIKHNIPNNLAFVRNFNDTDTIFGIKSQILEVIYNLIDNAFEAIEEKENSLPKEQAIATQNKIEITLIKKSDTTLIHISDNGIGIKEENVSKIFIPFFTTKSSRKSGTGIGMYIVKRLITENHKGKIRFESKYMSGTSIFIDLPNQ